LNTEGISWVKSHMCAFAMVTVTAKEGD